MLRRAKQDKNESVQIYTELLLAIAEDVFQGQDQADLAAIECRLVRFFIDGLAFDYLKLKVMRENPNRLQGSVAVAMAEQNLRRKFNLRRSVVNPWRLIRHDRDDVRYAVVWDITLVNA